MNFSCNISGAGQDEILNLQFNYTSWINITNFLSLSGGKGDTKRFLKNGESQFNLGVQCNKNESYERDFNGDYGDIIYIYIALIFSSK